MKRKDLAGDEAGNTRAIAPAYGELVPIGHGNEALSVVSVGPKFFNMLEIHDRRAMNPQKYVGIQFGFEISHGIAEHMAFFAGADSHIIFFRANPANIRDGQEEDSALGAKDQPVGIFLLLATDRTAPFVCLRSRCSRACCSAILNRSRVKGFNK